MKLFAPSRHELLGDEEWTESVATNAVEHIMADAEHALPRTAYGRFIHSTFHRNAPGPKSPSTTAPRVSSGHSIIYAARAQ